MTRTKRKLSSSSWIIPSLAIIILYLSNTVVSEAQFFDAFTANKRFFTGSKGGSGGLLGGLGGLGGGGGGGSGYGAPQKPSYGAPAQRPSYGTPQPKPSYGAQKPSYGAPGGGLNFKQIELPVPDINLPDPIEFKAGVLRSKGRIASGLLHAKAGILRAGANILAQKANALDKVAQAIPAVKAGLINTLKGFGGDKGGGGGYGAPQTGYGTPQQQSRPQYNQPQSYNAPSTGYGNPQGPPVLGQQNFNTQSVNVIPVNNLQNNLNNFNNQQQQQQNYNNQQQQQNFNNQNRPNNNLFFGNNNNGNSAPDSYGSPVANPIGPTNNNNQVSPLLFNNNNAQQVSAGYSVNNNNGVSNTNAQQVNQAYTSITGNSNSNQFSPIINNNALQTNSPLNNRGNNNLVNNALQVNTNVDSNTVTNQQLNALNSFINNNDISNQANPFLTNSEKLILQESRQQQSGNLNQLQRQGQCRSDSSLNNLLEDLFMGHEIIPDILDRPPQYPLELTYKTVRTFPGMQLTADMTRFKPMLHWPAKNNALYTVVMSNLDINNRRNRTLSEFWHWFVANIPGQSVDDGDTLFEHLFPLVLPEGDGDHRFGYFVFEQPGVLDYSDEGGPTDSCSPNMSNGRGPFKSTKNFQKKYGLTLTAATFLIIDYNEASMQIACEWQKCIGDTINLVSPLKCGNEEKK